MRRPILLDLFCGGGGAARGYYDAGFDVVGVDSQPHPGFPYRFLQADALEYLAAHGGEYDAIHASPPCKFSTGALTIRTGDEQECRAKHLDLITPIRPILQAISKPYVIENVLGAKSLLLCPSMLCGTMFGLKVLRHRYFETSFFACIPPHERHVGSVTGGEFCGPYGQGGAMWIDPKRKELGRRKGSRKTADWGEAMQIDWMTRDELTQAIPPAYTRFLGRQLREAL